MKGQRAYCDQDHPAADAEADAWCESHHRPQLPMSARRDECRFTTDDEKKMTDEAAKLGDRDALDAIRVGMEPVRRTMDDLLPRCWWTLGLRFEDLRESEYGWSIRHIGDAYSQAFQAVCDDYEAQP